jgi:site-specific DNA recombinase
MSVRTIRCAIYTRKSSEEGLEQDFNSLAAQREACAAYIASQAHEGWRAIPEHFDDGGYSGGTMERPALKRLMDLVRERKIDVIVIYKIDRLTRSLPDFARLAETLDEHGVSFVAVTQQFNTTTSMGRLMLNVLLSFAQFEREITGERIRDKIAASKKKGMWMGGNLPTGYDVQDRRLIINPHDAEAIRKIFSLYLEEGTVPRLVDRLEREGMRTAVRTSVKGRRSGGLSFGRGQLYRLLSNPVYIGRIPHKDKSYSGHHEPIIGRDLWDAVQAMLTANSQAPRTRRQLTSKHPSLLAGLLDTERGNRMIPSHANKAGQRYRYYIEKMETGRGSNAAALRLPAHELEAAAYKALGDFLRDGERVVDLFRETPHTISHALESAGRLAAMLSDENQPNVRMAAITVIERITCSSNSLQVRFVAQRVRTAIEQGHFQHDGDFDLPASDGNEPSDAIEFSVPLDIRRRGVQTKLVIGDVLAIRNIDHTLLKLLARANVWAEQLISGKVGSVAAIAEAENLTPSYVSRCIRSAFLAPELIVKILDGTQPPELTADRLINADDLPLGWEEQISYAKNERSKLTA